jgi:predicted DNA-binding ribbon-helix-helix protein
MDDLSPQDAALLTEMKQRLNMKPLNVLIGGKQHAVPVSDEEHQRLQAIASKRQMTIGQLLRAFFGGG